MTKRIADCGQTRTGILPVPKCERKGCGGRLVYRNEGNFYRCALCGDVTFPPPAPLVEVSEGEWR